VATPCRCAPPAAASSAGSATGVANFTPDACLINRYGPGTRLSLHQDRNERDFNQPVVSVSWGVPAVFLLGGLSRSDRALRLTLQHGDVLVWGGPARLRFHGVMPVAQADHPAFGSDRVNLTFRRAG
jgi:alkylated DNA repair protein (DNA oxidative demethylase)